MDESERDRVKKRSKAFLLKEYQIKIPQAEQEQSGNETWPLQGAASKATLILSIVSAAT